MWAIAQCAEKFHLSPLAVARELDEDASGTMLEALLFLRYAEAKAGLESKSEETREAWEKSPLSGRWSEISFDLHHRGRLHPEPVDGCKHCDRLRA